MDFFKFVQSSSISVRNYYNILLSTRPWDCKIFRFRDSSVRISTRGEILFRFLSAKYVYFYMDG